MTSSNRTRNWAASDSPTTEGVDRLPAGAGAVVTDLRTRLTCAGSGKTPTA